MEEERQQTVQQVQQPQQQQPLIQPQMTNAQQQQQYSMQAPQIAPNSLFTNAQQQQQLNMQAPYNAANNLFGNVQQQQPTTFQGYSNFNAQVQVNRNMQQHQVSRANQNLFGVNQGEMVQEMPNIFNDDQPFVESAKQTTAKEGKIDVSLIAQRSQVKLGEVSVLPAICKVVSSQGTRTSVDLVCVIDVSGSMNGEKINLVKQTMKVLVQMLTPSDRLSIITFQSYGKRICPLKAVTPQNVLAFNAYISNLNAGGGTTIMSGMNLALKTLRDRKQINKATSIFLLSDGQDRGAEYQLKEALARQENKDAGVFTIHSFGFGADHDEDLMNKICLQKDGSFYFIKEFDTLDEAFCNALGGIISMVASEVIVKVNSIAQGIVSGVHISKTFGPKWEKIKEGQYRLKLTQLMSEVSKEYVFELTVPAIEGQVGDIGREHVVLEGILEAKGANNQQMVGACSLSLTLINPKEEIAEINENVEVIENYLIAKAADAIQENMKKAEANHFEEAQQGIDSMINNIQSNKKARKQKMQVLVKDLQQIRQKCSPHDYHQQGKKWMTNACNAHMNRNAYQYSNNVQQQMVEERRFKKSNN